MKNLSLLACAILGGLILYVAVFVNVLHRPMTVDVIGDYIEQKTRILAGLEERKILIFAGSNGRYSHSCDEMLQVGNVACVNLSIAADLGIPFQFRHYIDHIRSGDLVYLPLEYRKPEFRNSIRVGVEAKYLAFKDPSQILSIYPPGGVGAAFFGFSFRDFIGSLGEMALSRVGVKRRVGVDTLNATGDEISHTAEKGSQYRALISSWEVSTIDATAYSDEKQWSDVRVLIAQLREKGAIVVGGLPTTFDDTVLPPGVVVFMTRLFESGDACFLTLSNRSMYPRTSFFDSNYHLNEEAQRLHSRNLLPELLDIFRRGGCQTETSSRRPTAPGGVHRLQSKRLRTIVITSSGPGRRRSGRRRRQQEGRSLVATGTEKPRQVSPSLGAPEAHEPWLLPRCHPGDGGSPFA
jgi:hypothetical protein